MMSENRRDDAPALPSFDPKLFEASLAPWAELPSRSRGRRIFEEGDERTPHQRDRDRIIHSTAFRRLKHKTQVFVAHEGDHYRTRLTHSLEVAQVARSLARNLLLNEDLTETIALAHDLGHPPFGHTGERVLDRCVASLGGFDHNVQSIRVVTELEQRYFEYDGLNLTFETLEGLAKHHGAEPDPHPVALKLDLPPDLDLGLHASLEAQVAAIADDVAYNTHDIDDGLRAGLFAFEDLQELPLMRPLLSGLSSDRPRSINELMRRQITMMVRDIGAETRRRLATLQPDEPADVRRARTATVSFSEECAAYDAALRKFLWDRVYDHPRMGAVREEARAIIQTLFERFTKDPGKMSDDWTVACAAASPHGRPRVVADYIAGMTDTYARDVHRGLA